MLQYDDITSRRTTTKMSSISNHSIRKPSPGGPYIKCFRAQDCPDGFPDKPGAVDVFTPSAGQGSDLLPPPCHKNVVVLGDGTVIRMDHKH